MFDSLQSCINILDFLAYFCNLDSLIVPCVFLPYNSHLDDTNVSEKMELKAISKCKCFYKHYKSDCQLLHTFKKNDSIE